jgi:hypothetical protein
MTITKSSCGGVLLCLTLSFLSLHGQQTRAVQTSGSCREFVEKFYSWYVATAARESQEQAGYAALHYRSYLFSPVIVQALKEDSEAQDKAGSELVSLDGDPFAGGDGVAEGYVVERATVKNGRCWAEVHGVWDAKEDDTADITPELVIKSDKWLFVNFYFPDMSSPKGWNLLSALKALRNGRKQNRSPKDHEP